MKKEYAFRCKPNGVPILSADEIDRYAESIVREICPELFTGMPDATDLKRLLQYLGNWHYSGQYLSRSGSLLGLASFEGGMIRITEESRSQDTELVIWPNTILIDRALYSRETMFRFTFAHECGHALYHRLYCSDPENMKAYHEQGYERMIRDMESSLSIRDRGGLQNDHDFVEWQANAFASSVLMPKELVYRVAEIVQRDGYRELEYMNQLNAVLTDVFKVSVSAAFYRMKELGLAEGWTLVKGVITPAQQCF